MDIEIRRGDRGDDSWIAEVWEPETPDWQYREPYPEEVYIEINKWCTDHLKYHARTAYHIFEFSSRKDLDWFLLRWSNG